MPWANRRVWTYAFLEGFRVSAIVHVGWIFFIEASEAIYSESLNSIIPNLVSDLKFTAVSLPLTAILIMFWNRWAVWKNSQIKRH